MHSLVSACRPTGTIAPMQLIRRLPCRLTDARPSALAIGNFDGLHRGHQALIECAVSLTPDNAPSLMCFEPLPQTLFAPDQPVPRLMGLRDRLRVSESMGIQRLFQLPFDLDFAGLSPQQFIDRAIIDGARAQHVIVGQDFRFGHRAAGDVDLLRRLGGSLGFDVHVIEPIMASDDEKVSSTGLRTALNDGNLDRAEAMLGRRYALSGRVLRGQQLGRTLGFPTLNLSVPVPPALAGIFAVCVNGLDDASALARWPGVASLGKRPTVNGKEWLLEVHLIDFDGELYGHHVSVEFIAKRRDEAHFDNLNDMTAVMQQDFRWAREQLQPIVTSETPSEQRCADVP